jgi:gas vesicle protein
MIEENEEYKNHSKPPLKVLAGIFTGFLAGTVTMLLLAPKSGKDTRVDIQNKGIELRDQTTDMMEDTIVQVRSNVNKIVQDSREKINEFRLDGEEVVLEQFDHNSKAAQAEK